MRMKKLLAVTLATSMVMASAFTVCAKTTTSSGGSGSSSSSSSSSSSQETAVVETYAEEKSESAGATITVGGVVTTTSIAGVYASETLQGVAVKTDLSTVMANLGLTSGQKPMIIIYDTDAKKSNLAMASVNAAVEALGGELVASLYIDLGAKQNGKWVTLTDGSVALAAGLPKGADTSKTYSVVCVQAGGVTTIYDDEDANAKTVTFPVQAGIGTYAIVAR